MVPAVSILADTIVRTVELGVTITNAAVRGETTVVWCDVVDRTPSRCPDCATMRVYRDSVERRLTDLPVAGASAAAEGAGGALLLPGVVVRAAGLRPRHLPVDPAGASTTVSRC